MRTNTMEALSAYELKNVNGGYGCNFVTNPDGRIHIEDSYKVPGLDDPFDIVRQPIFI